MTGAGEQTVHSVTSDAGDDALDRAKGGTVDFLLQHPNPISKAMGGNGMTMTIWYGGVRYSNG